MQSILLTFTQSFGLDLAQNNLLYLDPGSGSILLQILIASGLGAIFVLRSSWGKIKSFFQRSSSINEIDQDAQDE